MLAWVLNNRSSHEPELFFQFLLVLRDIGEGERMDFFMR